MERTQKETGTRRKRDEKRRPLPNIRLKLENEIAVLKACVEFSKYGTEPVTYKDLKIPGIHPNNISLELVFLSSINLLNLGSKRGEYTPTPEAVNFVNKLNEGKVKEAKKVLAEVLRTTWFGDLVLESLKIKEELTLNELIKVLGKDAHVDLKSDLRAIKRLFEWLEYAGIIELKGDKVRSKADTIQEPDHVGKIEKSERVEKASEIIINLSFLINIDPSTTKEDFKEIAKKIKGLIQEIRKELKEENF